MAPAIQIGARASFSVPKSTGSAESNVSPACIGQMPIYAYTCMVPMRGTLLRCSPGEVIRLPRVAEAEPISDGFLVVPMQIWRSPSAQMAGTGAADTRSNAQTNERALCRRRSGTSASAAGRMVITAKA